MYDLALYFDSDKFEHIMTFQRFDYQRRSSEHFGKISSQSIQIFILLCRQFSNLFLIF